MYTWENICLCVETSGESEKGILNPNLKSSTCKQDNKHHKIPQTKHSRNNFHIQHLGVYILTNIYKHVFYLL